MEPLELSPLGRHNPPLTGRLIYHTYHVIRLQVRYTLNNQSKYKSYHATFTLALAPFLPVYILKISLRPPLSMTHRLHEGYAPS